MAEDERFISVALQKLLDMIAKGYSPVGKITLRPKDGGDCATIDRWGKVVWKKAGE